MTMTTQGLTDFGGISVNANNKKKPTSANYAPPIVPTVTTPSSSLAGQTFAPLLDTLHNVGKPTIAPFAPVAPRFDGMAPIAITRPGNDYYQNLFGAKFAPLNRQYFDPNGVSDQAVGESNRRGFLTAGPSGVAGQLYEKTVTDPYARAVTDIQNQVNIIKTETEMDLAKYDADRQDEFRQFQADLINKDRDYGVASAEAQARIDNIYLSLESEINQAIANGATSEKLGELNARISTFTSLVAAETAIAKINQDAAQAQANWWIDAQATPGAIGAATPYESIGQPRPYPVDEKGNPLPGNPLYEGDSVAGTPSSSGDQRPRFNGRYDGDRAVGADGNVYVWFESSQEWKQ